MSFVQAAALDIYIGYLPDPVHVPFGLFLSVPVGCLNAPCKGYEQHNRSGDNHPLGVTTLPSPVVTQFPSFLSLFTFAEEIRSALKWPTCYAIKGSKCTAFRSLNLLVLYDDVLQVKRGY